MVDLRVLLTSDWHADATTAGYDRFPDVEAAVAETVEAAVAERCTHYVFLGDLCDPDESRWTRAVSLATRTAFALSEANIASRWVVGNHDVVEDGHGASTLAALAALEPEIDCRVFSAPHAGALSPLVDYVVLPYVPRSHAYDPARFVREVAAVKLVEPRRRVLVFGHLNVEGVVPGSETEDMPRGREVFFPVDACREVFGERATMFNGHYHRHQRTESGVWIPGSLERLTFGEADNHPGWFVVEVSDAKA